MLMLHEKAFHVDENKMMLHQKNILCAKKLFFPERRAMQNGYFLQLLVEIILYVKHLL